MLRCLQVEVARKPRAQFPASACTQRREQLPFSLSNALNGRRVETAEQQTTDLKMRPARSQTKKKRRRTATTEGELLLLPVSVLGARRESVPRANNGYN